MAGGHPTKSPNKGPWIRGRFLKLIESQAALQFLFQYQYTPQEAGAVLQ